MIDNATFDTIIAGERRDLEDTTAEITTLANINSGTTNHLGTAAVQHHLADRLKSIGCHVEVRPSTLGRAIDDDGSGIDVSFGPMLFARFRPAAADRVLIVGHSDTVFDQSHPFQRARRDNSLLRGPGVADMKGGLVAVCRSLGALERHDLAPNLGVDIMINADEETGSLGSADALTAAAAGATTGIGLALEPRLPDESFAGSRPASANVVLVVEGRTSHAGRDLTGGRNAVLGAARLAMVADGLTGTRPRMGVNVAAIVGSRPLNAVPDRCVVRINLRAPATEDLTFALQQIDAAIASEQTDHDLTVTRSGGIHRPAKPWTEASRQLAELVTARAIRADLPGTFTDTGGVCDGNNLTEAGLAVVDTLGVGGGGIHTDGEFTDLTSLPATVTLLTDVLTSIAELPTNGQPTAAERTTP